jgi:hypothetical protein
MRLASQFFPKVAMSKIQKVFGGKTSRDQNRLRHSTGRPECLFITNFKMAVND